MADDLLTSLPTIEAVLAEHAGVLGRDAVGYRHHVYRVVNLCVAFAPPAPDDLDTIAIAAVFHDLGIWTAGTFDYLPPSVALAEAYLARTRRAARGPAVTAMIGQHHKVSSYRGPHAALVETLRRADWVDVTWGARTFGLPRSHIARIRVRWPDAGFHLRLLQLALARAIRHPLSPLPMLRL